MFTGGNGFIHLLQTSTVEVFSLALDFDSSRLFPQAHLNFVRKAITFSHSLLDAS